MLKRSSNLQQFIFVVIQKRHLAISDSANRSMSCGILTGQTTQKRPKYALQSYMHILICLKTVTFGYMPHFLWLKSIVCPCNWFYKFELSLGHFQLTTAASICLLNPSTIEVVLQAGTKILQNSVDLRGQPNSPNTTASAVVLLFFRAEQKLTKLFRR